MKTNNNVIATKNVFEIVVDFFKKQIENSEYLTQTTSFNETEAFTIVMKFFSESGKKIIERVYNEKKEKDLKKRSDLKKQEPLASTSGKIKKLEKIPNNQLALKRKFEEDVNDDVLSKKRKLNENQPKDLFLSFLEMIIFRNSKGEIVNLSEEVIKYLFVKIEFMVSSSKAQLAWGDVNKESIKDATKFFERIRNEIIRELLEFSMFVNFQETMDRLRSIINKVFENRCIVVVLDKMCKQFISKREIFGAKGLSIFYRSGKWKEYLLLVERFLSHDIQYDYDKESSTIVAPHKDNFTYRFRNNFFVYDARSPHKKLETAVKYTKPSNITFEIITIEFQESKIVNKQVFDVLSVNGVVLYNKTWKERLDLYKQHFEDDRDWIEPLVEKTPFELSKLPDVIVEDGLKIYTHRFICTNGLGFGTKTFISNCDKPNKKNRRVEVKETSKDIGVIPIDNIQVQNLVDFENHFEDDL